MSLYCKKPFEDSLSRDMFNGSDMDCCMTDWTSIGVNINVQNVQDWVLFGQLSRWFIIKERLWEYIVS
jgi:hypothetical protein